MFDIKSMIENKHRDMITIILHQILHDHIVSVDVSQILKSPKCPPIPQQYSQHQLPLFFLNEPRFVRKIFKTIKLPFQI